MVVEKGKREENEKGTVAGGRYGGLIVFFVPPAFGREREVILNRVPERLEEMQK